MKTKCISIEELASFNVGLLPTEELDRVSRHLENCVSCRSRLTEMEHHADPLVQGLRAAATSGDDHTTTPCEDVVEAVEKIGAERSFDVAPDGDQTAEWEPELRKIRDYRLLTKLGADGMGAVYLARHTRLDMQVAVKVMSDRRTDSPRAVARFQREMKAIGRLKHPHIVQALDAGKEGDVHYLVMEYVDGVDLSQVTKHCHPLAVADVCELIRQAALALQCAHDHDLTHRDVKPSNLMVDREGVVKLLDLGLARLQDEPGSGETPTAQGHVLGTPDYMAPEQIDDPTRVDFRADLYSLGCTMYRLLAGAPPYGPPEYSSFAAVVAAHQSKPFPSIRRKRPDVPPPLEELLGRLTAKDPQERPAAAGEVARALAPYCEKANLPDLLASANLPPAPPSMDVETPDLTGKATASAGRSKTRFPLRVITCVTAALLVGVLLWRLVPWPKQTEEIGTSETASSDSTAVDKVVIWVRRGASDENIERWEWEGGASEEPPAFDPLAPSDAFKIRAEFNRPTYWYLVWFDTAGLVEIAARGPRPETVMDYPREEKRMQQVNPATPRACIYWCCWPVIVGPRKSPRSWRPVWPTSAPRRTTCRVFAAPAPK